MLICDDDADDDVDDALQLGLMTLEDYRQCEQQVSDVTAAGSIRACCISSTHRQFWLIPPRTMSTASSFSSMQNQHQ